MKSTVKLLPLLLILSVGALSQTIERLDGSKLSAAEVDATVTRLMKAAEVTGAGIAIINHDRVVYEKGYGFRDTEKQLPLTTTTVMSGASLTKAAFAYVVMQLVQEGRLDLDKPVYQYLPKPLPEYPQYAGPEGRSAQQEDHGAHAARPHERLPQLARV